MLSNAIDPILLFIKIAGLIGVSREYVDPELAAAFGPFIVLGQEGADEADQGYFHS